MGQSTKKFVVNEILESRACRHVDGVGPFQVYSIINWILHCKVDGEKTM